MAAATEMNRRRRLWFNTEAEMFAATNLPDGTPVGAVETQLTGTYDTVRGLISDIPVGLPGATLVAGASGQPMFANFGAANPGSVVLTGDATETDTFAVAVPAGRLGPNGRIRIVQHLYLKNESASAIDQTATLYGTDASGEVEAKSVTYSLPVMPPGGMFHSVAIGLLEFEVWNLGSTADQMASVQVRAAKYVSTLLDRIVTADIVDVISARGGTDFETAGVFSLRTTYAMGSADPDVSWTVGPSYLETVYQP